MEDTDRRSIAIVDDDEMVLKVFKKRFQNKYDIHTFESPSKFLEEIEKVKPDLFIVDWEMPDMDGLEADRFAVEALAVRVFHSQGAESPAFRPTGGE